jgi:alkylation response protein AidB-like acyl-CoA dehydrogenase
LGLLDYEYAPEDGGSGPDPLADVVVTEELARCGSGDVAAGLGATKDLAPYYVARFGSPEQRRQWLVPAARGEAVASARELVAWSVGLPESSALNHTLGGRGSEQNSRP